MQKHDHITLSALAGTCARTHAQSSHSYLLPGPVNSPVCYQAQVNRPAPSSSLRLQPKADPKCLRVHPNVENRFEILKGDGIVSTLPVEQLCFIWNVLCI